MRPVTIPLLYCPFTPAVNPLAADAARHTDAWVSTFHIHTGAAYSQYQEDNFAWLSARFFPQAELDRLILANDFIVLLFAIDDLLDHQQQRAHLAQQPERLHTFISRFNAVIDEGAVFGQEDGPVIAAWSDLWPRIARVSPPEWAAHFALHLNALLNAGLHEFVNAQLPTVGEYMEKRPSLAGAHISTFIIPVINDIWLPEEVQQHSVLTELELLCRRLICWSNDLFSFSKEQLHGDEHNLVTILQQERQLNEDEAIICAAAIHNTDMRKFVTLSAQLPAYDEKTDQAQARYVEAMRRHIRGNVDWSEKDSRRYSFVYGTALNKGART